MKNRIKLTNRILPAGGIISVAAAAALLITTGPPALGAESRAVNPGPAGVPDMIVPPVVETTPYGSTYAQWAAKYWQRRLSFPAFADPASDTAPPDTGQSGPVWFLDGVHGRSVVNGHATVARQLGVPEGTALFFSVLSVFADNTGCPYNNPPLTFNQLKAQVLETWNSSVSVTYCTIDGVAVSGLDNPLSSPYLIQTPPFAYALAKQNNLLAAAYGEPCIADGTRVGPAVAEGIFLMVPPLAPSVLPHIIRFGGIAGPVSKPSLSIDITYVVYVRPSTSNAIP